MGSLIFQNVKTYHSEITEKKTWLAQGILRTSIWVKLDKQMKSYFN